MAQFAYNPNQHAFSTPRERCPRGWYPAIIETSEIVATSTKNGFRLVLGFVVIDGPYKGRKAINGLNIDNPSAQAVEIAMNEIKTINYCIGNFQPINQTEEMHNKPLQILLTEPKDSDFNEVKGYKTIDGQDADKIGAPAAIGHVAIPAQGYGQPVPTAPAPPAVAQQLSPDGQWKLVNGGWVPNTPPAPAPPPPPPPPAAPAWNPPPPPPAAVAQPYGAPPPLPGAGAPAWTPGATPQAPAWAPPR